MTTRPNEIIVQIGSNKGDTDNDPVYRFLSANRHRLSEIRCVFIEPNPHAFARLNAVYAFVPNKQIIMCAVSDTNGVRLLFEDNEAAGQNISQHASLNRDHLKKMGHQEQVISCHAVPALKLAHILRDLELPYVSWLQIDTEGHDHVILKSLEGITTPIDMIQFEYIHFPDLGTPSSPLLDLIQRFHAKGYQSFKFGDDIVLAQPEATLNSYLTDPLKVPANFQKTMAQLTRDWAMREFSAIVNRKQATGNLLYVSLSTTSQNDEYAALFPSFRPTIHHALPQEPDKIYATDFPDAAWDLVICVQLIAHMPEPWRLAKELARIIRPSGWLIIDCSWIEPSRDQSVDSSAYWLISQQGLTALFEKDFEIALIVADNGTTSCLMRSRASAVRPVTENESNEIDMNAVYRPYTVSEIVGAIYKLSEEIDNPELKDAIRLKLREAAVLARRMSNKLDEYKCSGEIYSEVSDAQHRDVDMRGVNPVWTLCEVLRTIFTLALDVTPLPTGDKISGKLREAAVIANRMSSKLLEHKTEAQIHSELWPLKKEV
jgi:FkbM family methyltransferase